LIDSRLLYETVRRGRAGRQSQTLGRERRRRRRLPHFTGRSLTPRLSSGIGPPPVQARRWPSQGRAICRFTVSGFALRAATCASITLACAEPCARFDAAWASPLSRVDSAWAFAAAITA